jgi:hypothetical protein
MLCSRWFSLENLAYTAARIAILLQRPHELRSQQLRQMIGERDHLRRQRLPRFPNPLRCSAH